MEHRSSGPNREPPSYTRSFVHGGKPHRHESEGSFEESTTRSVVSVDASALEEFDMAHLCCLAPQSGRGAIESYFDKGGGAFPAPAYAAARLPIDFNALTLWPVDARRHGLRVQQAPVLRDRLCEG
jgi:hypothetical protein